MKKQTHQRGHGKKKLPPEYLTVDYLPHKNPEQMPVRGGKRAPEQSEEAADRGETNLKRKER